MIPTSNALAYYRCPSGMSAAGRHAGALARLPRELPALVAAIQGLLLHEYGAEAYGVELVDEQREDSHIRPVETVLERLLEDGPLTTARKPARRLVGVCNRYALLTAAALRLHAVPARVRCGFGSYFSPNYEDHWLTEYWDADAKRWRRVDAQMDRVWREMLGIDFDPLDVPADRFLSGGEAWQRCRAGLADPTRFGIDEMRGLWFVAGDLLRDVAALNKQEMLPWDVWGAMGQPDETIDAERLVFFDRVAALAAEPDAQWTTLRQLYEKDERLRVPPQVFNAKRMRPESIA